MFLSNRKPRPAENYPPPGHRKSCELPKLALEKQDTQVSHRALSHVPSEKHVVTAKMADPDLG